MPNPGLGEPFVRVTINLWEKDIEWCKKRYGPGWQPMVREMVRAYIRGINNLAKELRDERD
jgi:hypothetical protein